MAQLEQSTRNCGHRISNYTEVDQKLIENWEQPKSHSIFMLGNARAFCAQGFFSPYKFCELAIFTDFAYAHAVKRMCI